MYLKRLHYLIGKKVIDHNYIYIYYIIIFHTVSPMRFVTLHSNYPMYYPMNKNRPPPFFFNQEFRFIPGRLNRKAALMPSLRVESRVHLADRLVSRSAAFPDHVQEDARTLLLSPSFILKIVKRPCVK